MTQKTETSRFGPSPGSAQGQNRRSGFTLIELAVALTIILMVVAMVVPTLTKMLSSRSQKEAFNLVAAQLTAARAEAISGDTYAGVHIQLGKKNDKYMSETTYSMIIGAPNPQNPVFQRWSNFIPQELPGGTGMGQLTKEYIEPRTTSPGSGGGIDDSDKYKDIGSETQLRNFCAFSVIFSPDGAVATKPGGGNVKFRNDATFASGDKQLWNFDEADNEPGVTIFTMFDYKKVLKLDGTATDKATTGRNDGTTDREFYLNENGQFLPVNMHTGQLFDRY